MRKWWILLVVLVLVSVVAGYEFYQKKINKGMGIAEQWVSSQFSFFSKNPQKSASIRVSLAPGAHLPCTCPCREDVREQAVLGSAGVSVQIKARGKQRGGHTGTLAKNMCLQLVSSSRV